jgi:hypothetical protein
MFGWKPIAPIGKLRYFVSVAIANENNSHLDIITFVRSSTALLLAQALATKLHHLLSLLHNLASTSSKLFNY